MRGGNSAWPLDICSTSRSGKRKTCCQVGAVIMAGEVVMQSGCIRGTISITTGATSSYITSRVRMRRGFGGAARAQGLHRPELTRIAGGNTYFLVQTCGSRLTSYKTLLKPIISKRERLLKNCGHGRVFGVRNLVCVVDSAKRVAAGQGESTGSLYRFEQRIGGWHT